MFRPRNMSHVFTCKNVYRACEGAALGEEDPGAGGYDGPWRMFVREAGGLLPRARCWATKNIGGGEGLPRGKARER